VAEKLNTAQFVGFTGEVIVDPTMPDRKMRALTKTALRETPGQLDG
jgi:hypothetical protein